MTGQRDRLAAMLCAITAMAVVALVVVGVSPAAALGNGSISGTVSPDGGGPLNPSTGIVVYAYDSMGNEVASGWAQLGQGSYSITGLAAGSYRLRFRDSSSIYATEYYRNRQTLDAGDAVVVVAGANTSGIDAQVALRGSITGTVRAEGGGAINASAVIAVTAHNM
ncbi:MAG: hypothetical protein WCI74_11610, partial [Actinomycetes bacterium]